MLDNSVGVSTEVQHWPDDIPLPEVSFDIRLGAEVASIDFDYGSYVHHLRTNGLFLCEIADTKIVFTTSSEEGLDGFNQETAEKFTLPDSYQGMYDSAEEVMYVRAGRAQRVIPVGIRKRVNTTLVHETQHRIDFVTGYAAKVRPTPKYNTENMIKSERSMQAAAGIGVTGVIAFVVAEKLKVDTRLIDGCIAAPVIIAGLGSVAQYAKNVIPYLRDPLEVRARKASKENKTDFVSIAR